MSEQNKRSVNLPFNPSIPLADQCSHGNAWTAFCRDCRIVWLQHGLQDRERSLARDKAELDHLLRATPTVAGGRDDG